MVLNLLYIESHLFLAKNLIKRLICKKESRLDAEAALNHDFFKNEENKSIQNEECSNDLNDTIEDTTPFYNMKNFNRLNHYFSLFIM